MSYFSVSHKLVSGKEGVIEVRTGATPAISKNRQSGHLLVVMIQNNPNPFEQSSFHRIYFKSSNFRSLHHKTVPIGGSLENRKDATMPEAALTQCDLENTQHIKKR